MHVATFDIASMTGSGGRSGSSKNTNSEERERWEELCHSKNNKCLPWPTGQGC